MVNEITEDKWKFIFFFQEVNDCRIIETSLIDKKKKTIFSRSSIWNFFGNYLSNLAEFLLWFLDFPEFCQKNSPQHKKKKITPEYGL